MGNFRDLIVYQKAFDFAMEIFEISKSYPASEKYSITDQMRRSSRSVNANIAEAYRKRRYPNHFISKISDAEAELAETQVWLDFSLASRYIDQAQFIVMDQKAEEVMRLLNYMIKHPEKFS